MSAAVVDIEHINTLVWAGLLPSQPSYTLRWFWDNPTRCGQLDHDTADEVGAMLLAENVRSVGHRYNELTVVPDYVYRAPAVRTWTPTELLSALACYEYNACEHPDWKTSQAYAFVDALRAKLITHLPGWQDAPWFITASTIPARTLR